MSNDKDNPFQPHRLDPAPRGKSLGYNQDEPIGMHTPPGTVVQLKSGGPFMTVSGIAKPTPERLDYALETVWINADGEVKSLCAPFAVFVLDRRNG